MRAREHAATRRLRLLINWSVSSLTLSNLFKLTYILGAMRRARYRAGGIITSSGVARELPLLRDRSHGLF